MSRRTDKMWKTAARVTALPITEATEPKQLTTIEPTRLLECGCCGQFHPERTFLPGGSANYKNDCRYDANRFSSDEDYTERTGLPAVEVWLDEQAEDESV